MAVGKGWLPCGLRVFSGRAALRFPHGCLPARSSRLVLPQKALHQDHPGFWDRF